MEQASAYYSKLYITDRLDSWPIGKLGDLIEIQYGKDHKGLATGNIPIFGSGGIIRFGNKALYSDESVLIPRKGTLNNVIYINQPFWSVDTMFFTKMKKPDIAKFVFFFLKSKDLAGMNMGSAVPSMTADTLKNIQLYIPDDNTLRIFSKFVDPLFEYTKKLSDESKKLSDLRDLLLPKLLSGEIEIK